MNKYYSLEVAKSLRIVAIQSASEKNITKTISLYNQIYKQIMPIKNEHVRKYLMNKYAVLSAKPQMLSKQQKIELQKIKAKEKSLELQDMYSNIELAKLEKPSIKSVTDALSAEYYIRQNKGYHQNVQVVKSHVEKSHKELMEAIQSAPKEIQKVIQKKNLYIPPSTTTTTTSTKKKTLYIPPSTTTAFQNKFSKSKNSIFKQVDSKDATPKKTLYIPPKRTSSKSSKKTTFVQPTKKVLNEKPVALHSQVHLTDLIGNQQFLFAASN